MFYVLYGLTPEEIKIIGDSCILSSNITNYPGELILKRYHPVSAIILGIFLVGFLTFILPNIPPLSDILVFPILILGGFIATYLSKINKAIYGLYKGLTFSIVGYLPIILISKTIPLTMIIIMISSVILGLLGGYIGKSLRLREIKIIEESLN